MVRFYIDEKSESALKDYRYHCSDTSLLYIIYGPIFRFIASKTPIWLTPNILTVSGFVSNLVILLVISLTHPGYDIEKTSWIYTPSFFLLGFMVLYYQAIDAIDGMHARSNSMSTPLGELYDHGCDAVSVFAIVNLYLAGILQLGNVSLVFYAVLTTQIITYFVHWEEYTTLILRMGALISVTEMLFCVQASCIITGFTRGWPVNIEIQYFSEIIGERITVGYILCFLFVIIVFPLQVFDTFRIIHKEINIKKTKSVTDRKLTMSHVVIGLIPVTYTSLIFVAWFFSDIQFYRDHTLLFVSALALVMCYLSGRMIVLRLCLKKMRLFHFILVPITFGFVLNVFFFPDDDVFKVYIFWVMYFILLGFYVHFVVFVSLEMSQVLQIPIFGSFKFTPSNEDVEEEEKDAEMD